MISCRKDSFNTDGDAEISMSADTIHFDTLFTTTGSVTHFFKIFNDNDQKLRISSISLGGGENSFYKINADGNKGPQVTNLEIEAKDSLYVFVTIEIDQTAADLPFIVQDSISVSYNGNTKWVQLQAWGQNANFMRAKLITSDTTWSNDKPFVILDGLLIAEGVELKIQQGTKIYLHADAPFIVDGTLTANGKKYDSTKIVFQGDRLDEFYRDLPASWPGIYFRGTSTNNLLKNVIVKNAYQGIVAEKQSLIPGAKVTLEECIIDNCYDAGILGVNSSIKAVNCLISNCGKNIQLVEGGAYEFVHCTDVAISNTYISHRQPVLAITDFIKIGDAITLADVSASFINCIFWGANGTVENEVITAREGTGVFDVNFESCLWKLVEEPEGVVANQVISNVDPKFETVNTRDNIYSFRLMEGSPAINSGIDAVISTDLDGNNRTNIPDIGAYETTF
jgi:parallel beta-helix repeat protein